jgi:hypothetical protein
MKNLKFSARFALPKVHCVMTVNKEYGVPVLVALRG